MVKNDLLMIPSNQKLIPLLSTKLNALKLKCNSKTFTYNRWFLLLSKKKPLQICKAFNQIDDLWQLPFVLAHILNVSVNEVLRIFQISTTAVEYHQDRDGIVQFLTHHKKNNKIWTICFATVIVGQNKFTNCYNYYGTEWVQQKGT